MTNEIKINELNSEISKLNHETEEIDDQLRKNTNNSEEVYQQSRMTQEMMYNIRDAWHKDESMLRWLENVDDDIQNEFKQAQMKFDETEDELRSKKRYKENTIEDVMYEKSALQNKE